MTAKATMRTIIAMPPTTAPAITGTGAVTLFSLIVTAKKIINNALMFMPGYGPSSFTIVLFTPYVPIMPSRHNFRDIELKYGFL